MCPLSEKRLGRHSRSTCNVGSNKLSSGSRSEPQQHVLALGAASASAQRAVAREVQQQRSSDVFSEKSKARHSSITCDAVHS